MKVTMARGIQTTSMFSSTLNTRMRVALGPVGLYSAASKAAQTRLIVPRVTRLAADTVSATLPLRSYNENETGLYYKEEVYT